jgi:hypothetical protein
MRGELDDGPDPSCPRVCGVWRRWHLAGDVDPCSTGAGIRSARGCCARFADVLLGGVVKLTRYAPSSGRFALSPMPTTPLTQPRRHERLPRRWAISPACDRMSPATHPAHTPIWRRLTKSRAVGRFTTISLRFCRGTQELHHASSSSSALASCRTGVSKPSVNQP